MVSPFPGMDPFLESQRFDDFHHTFVIVVRELLVPLVRPRYVVDAERYVFFSGATETPSPVRPDVSLTQGSGVTPATARPDSVATLEPQIMAVPACEEDGQMFLTIRSRDGRQVVTVIELLSPTNKDPTGGQREYLTKRENYLKTLASVVEVDLLRGGARLPTREPLLPADYFSFVIRHGDRSHAEVYSWSLRDRLPVIPVPLLPGESDVGLDLQKAFELTYDRSGYDYAIDYDRDAEPDLNELDRVWVRERLNKRP